MCVEGVLDLAGVDIVAAADHRLRHAIDEEQVAVLVEGARDRPSASQPSPSVTAAGGSGSVQRVTDDRGPAELRLAELLLVGIVDAHSSPDGCPTDPGLPRRPTANVVASQLGCRRAVAARSSDSPARRCSNRARDLASSCANRSRADIAPSRNAEDGIHVHRPPGRRSHRRAGRGLLHLRSSLESRLRTPDDPTRRGSREP